jgi:hypothetical protein
MRKSQVAASPSDSRWGWMAGQILFVSNKLPQDSLPSSEAPGKKTIALAIKRF